MLYKQLYNYYINSTGKPSNLKKHCCNVSFIATNNLLNMIIKAGNKNK